MDFLNKFANEAAKATGNQQAAPQQQQQHQPSGGDGGLFGKLHGMVGGGPESEKKEDALDKGKAPLQNTWSTVC